MKLKFRRVKPGEYVCGSFKIYRVVSQQTNRADETLWTVSEAGRWLRDCDTLSFAKQIAQERSDRSNN